MRLLLDTQIALWWLTYPKRIVPSVREWVEQAEDGVFVSRASLWELAIKISLGKLRLDLPRFVRQAERDGFSGSPSIPAIYWRSPSFPSSMTTRIRSTGSWSHRA
jgi:PIN domain nuclease of toxin-antitoxin system